MEETISVIEQWMTEAERAARRLPDSPVSRGLRALPGAYTEWALRELADDGHS